MLIHLGQQLVATYQIQVQVKMFYKSIYTSQVNLNVTSFTDTGLELSGFSALGSNTDFIVHFTEARREESWNENQWKAYVLY